MKRHPLANLTSGLACAVLLGVTAQAVPFVYNPTDLLLGFRKSGANDLVVDLGPVSSWYVYGGQSTLQPNTTYSINAYSGSQLSSVFGSLNGISFSAFADVRTTDNPYYPQQTLFATAPRVDLNVQSDPWVGRSSLNQANTASKIEGIANGAVTYSGLATGDPVNYPVLVNTATAVEVATTWNANGISYTRGIGASGNFASTFQGNVENTTFGDVAIVSDLYEMQPNQESVYLGCFTLGTDGNMSFTTVPEPSGLALLGGGFVLLALRNTFRRKS